MSKTEWKEYKLGEIYEVHNGLSKGREFFGSGYPFISFSTVFNKWFIPEIITDLAQTTESEQESYSIKAGDILVTRTSETADELGMSCVALKDIPKATYNGFCKRMRQYNKDIDVDPKYVGYYMRNPEFRKNFQAFAGSMSTRASLTNDALLGLTIKLPPLAEQQRIAKILSSLDDKIELNNAINRNLEEQAQAIFKNWFIDFEPFGGKMPEDWQTGKLSDIAEYEKDKIDVAKLNAETYYSTENMLPNKAGVSKAASLPTTEQTTRCIPGETIISNIRPYFKKIFYCTEEIAGCSADVLCFKPKKESFSIYNYDLLYSDNFFDYMVKGSKGTKMPRGDKSQIMNYDVVIPAESVISDFNNVVSNILQQISNNKKENECLAKLRDALLPDLMSGELCLLL